MIAWLRAYAAATATTANYATIMNAATAGFADKPARNTVSTYRDVLEQIWILDPLSAWHPTGSALSILGSSPKHHLADPALAVQLLGLTPEALLDGKGSLLDPHAGTLLGALFESLITLCVRVMAQAAEATTHHLRLQGGTHELDIVVVRPDGAFIALEVKLASSISDHDVKHLHWAKKQFGERLLDAIVITTGSSAYRRPDGIGVLPLGLLGS